MDIVATVNQETQQVIEKVEQDDSFKVNEESGVFSNGSNSISTDTNSWIFYENEVMDASVFSLPEYVQSSNIKAERPEADFSSISQEFSHQVLPGQRESTHIGHGDWATPRVDCLFKLEAEGDKNDELLKEEFENTFGSENDASFDYKFNAFPRALNPGFDLQIALSYGSQLRGQFYNDYCTGRVRDLARIKASKMLICRTRIEIALVRPGIIGSTENVASVRINEERLAHFKFASLNKAKGEIIQDEGFESGCLSLELGAVVCRTGCQICSLKTKVDHLKRICPNISDGPVCCNQVTAVVTDILDQCAEPEWLVADKDLLKYLEFCLWESYRTGASFHCSGSSPCLWIDTDKILTLARKALGKLWFRDLNSISKVDSENFELEIFNDDKHDELVFKREHLIVMEATIITGYSLVPFTAELKKWNGGSEICYSSKNRRKINFAGIDLPKPVHTNKMICWNPEGATFKGASFIKPERPNPLHKLYPVNLLNRTFIG